MGTLDLLCDLLKARAGEAAIDAGTVRAGLASGDAGCIEVAADLAGRDTVAFAPALLRLWDEDARARPVAVEALRGDPLLALPRRAMPGQAWPMQREGGPAIQAAFAAGRIPAILHETARLLRDDIEDVADLLRPLPGLHRLAATREDSPIPAATRQALAAKLAEWEAWRSPPQVAIAPSYRCSRGCAYCFVEDRDAAPVMTPEAFGRVLDAVARPGELRKVNVFGGEPTEVDALPAMAREAAARGLTFYFSTHGLCDPGRFAGIVAAPNLEMVTVHVDRPVQYRPRQREALHANLSTLRRRGVQVVLRYTLWDPQARDFAFLDPFLEAAPDAPVSFAVTFPSGSRRNRHAALADLPRFAPKILDLVRHVDARFPGRTMVLAKPFPLCAFAGADLGLLLRRVDVRNVCEVDRQGFTDQVLVGPDGTTSPCMALTGAPWRIDGVVPRDEAAARFAAVLRPVLEQPVDPRCDGCAMFACGACQAACYAYLGDGA